MKHPGTITILFTTLAAVSCRDKDDTTTDAGGSGGNGGATAPTLCLKYGGADNVATVVSKNIIADSIATDCRINAFFSSLGEQSFHRVNDCLTAQVQELFGCAGISYVGSTSRDGLGCRSMLEAHAGVGISNGDFDALIEDVVKGLQSAGVEQADIDAAAPALLGMQADIVEKENDANAMSMCQGGAGGVGGGP